MGDKVQGTLVIIGGAEEKNDKCEILRKVTELAGQREASLVIMTAATEMPEVVGEDYRRTFKRLGVKKTIVLNITSREEANDTNLLKCIEDATGIFFTGGDQLRITSLLGGTSAYEKLHEAYNRGVVIAGTSAGASVMSSTMIVEGDSEKSPQMNTLKMSPGMGLINGVVVDQHFAQRGRIGRLLTAVAQNPYVLGIGLDEDTAIVVGANEQFEVYGSQTVTVVDGENITATNVSESKPNEFLTLTDIRLHVLAAGYGYDLKNRTPLL
jgi:cyanophycinase